MQYLCYSPKDDLKTVIKLEYKGDLDIKLIAALTFIITKGGMDTSLSLIVDSIEGNLQYEKIYQIFDEQCIIVKDNLQEVLNKKIVTVADLFS